MVTTPTRKISLKAGQLVMLHGGLTHGVHALTDSSLLVTILLETK
jgi:quercetin dioxygenase-like cupin family protein